MGLHGLSEYTIKIIFLEVLSLKNAFKSIMNNVADYKSVAEVCHTASEGV
jgi:hypothetical protein